MRFRHAALLAVLAAPVFAGPAFGYEALQPIDRNPSFLEAKITAVIHSVGEAINKDDFTSFREGYLVSSLMTKRISDQQLHDAFRLLIASKVDLTRLESVKPIMDGPPEEDAEHQLLVSGHYDTSLHVEFRMGFIREGSHLGLSKLDLSASPATTGAPVAASGPAATSDPATRAANQVETARTDTMIAPDVMASLLTDASLPKGITLPADQREAVVAAIHALTLGVTARDMDLFLKQDIVSPRWRHAQTGDRKRCFVAETAWLAVPFRGFLAILACARRCRVVRFLPLLWIGKSSGECRFIPVVCR